MSAATTTSPAKPRRWFVPRFSLRTLLIVITLLCLTVAPMMPEVNRASHVARQVKVIEDMGGTCVFVDRPQSFAAWLVRNCWPVRLPHLEDDLLMAEFNEQTVDLAKLAQTPDVRGVCFNECQFVAAEDVRCPRIEYVQLQERTASKGGSLDPAIMRRFPRYFPNLRKAQLMGVPQEQEFVDCLAHCTRLEDLEVAWVFDEDPEQIVGTAPLQHLNRLRRLKMSGTDQTWEWSFLQRLENLEDADLDVQRNLGVGTIYAERFDPSNQMAHLKRLRHIRLYGQSKLESQLTLLVFNNPLETFRIPLSWRLQAALAELSREPTLRRLEGVWVVDGGDQGEQVFDALQRISQLRELEIWISSLTDENLRRLSELKQLEQITLTFDPHSGCVTSDGIALFQKLPIVELRYSYSSGLPLGEGMQRVVDNWRGSPGGIVEPQYAEGLKFLQRRPASVEP